MLENTVAPHNNTKEHAQSMPAAQHQEHKLHKTGKVHARAQTSLLAKFVEPTATQKGDP
jgi:hypothetical protein